MGSGRREDRWAYWQKLVNDQRVSGLSMTAFCRERVVSDASFYAWRRRLEADASEVSDAAPAQFVSVPLTPTESAFELRIPNGMIVTVAPGFDEVELRRLLRVAAKVEPDDA